ncbi:hypothetical protein JCM5296_007092 [Sporobolomyces johnsonii]
MSHPTATPAPPSPTRSLPLERTPPRTPVLPLDVMDLILDECLSDHALARWDYAKALSLTCRALRERAQPVLWEQIDLPETTRGWDSARLRAIYTTPRIADMVANVCWSIGVLDRTMPDWVLQRIEELFLACRNISAVHIYHLEAVHFPRVLNAIGASDSRTTINTIEISGAYLLTRHRLTEAVLQLYLLSFPSLANLDIRFFVDPTPLASSELLNLRTFKFLTLPDIAESHTQYLSLLQSINPHTLRVFETSCTSHLDWLCRPGFTLDTLSLVIWPLTPPLLLPQLTRLLPFHPNLHHLKLQRFDAEYVPCEDSADLTALRQIFSILPPTLRSLDLPFEINPETTPIQQLIINSPCKRLVWLGCRNSATEGPFWLRRRDETADWRVL